MVTTAGRPSGMAATASETAIRNISSAGSPRATPSPNTAAQMASAAMASHLPNWPRRCCSGVASSSPACRSSAIRPMAVAMPVETTSPRARPIVTAVPEKAMFRWSAGVAAPTSGSGTVILATGSDSPVRAASSIFSPGASSKRMSAVTISPCSSSTTSPGTTSAAGTTVTSPPRRTRACGDDIRLSASMAWPARYSCTKPTTPLKRTMARMMAVSLAWPMRNVTTAAPRRTRIMGLAN